MLTPKRSFTLPKGFWLSSFATTSAPHPSVTRLSRTSGVCPISSVTSFAIFINTLVPFRTGFRGGLPFPRRKTLGILAEASGGRTHRRRGDPPPTGFEDRDDHRTACASGKSRHGYTRTSKGEDQTRKSSTILVFRRTAPWRRLAAESDSA